MRGARRKIGDAAPFGRPRSQTHRGHVDWFDRSALSHRRAPWRRWDGRSVSSGGCPPRSFGRAQVPACRSEGRSRQPRAAAERSARRVAPAVAQHRGDLRHRRIERRRLHRDGVCRGRAAVVARGEGAAGDPRGRGDRSAGHRRPRRGAQPRDRAPRRQEREPDADRARARQGARLRVGQVREARGRRGGPAHAAAGHDRRHGRRDRVVHGARAGARAVGRSPDGSLLARRRALRARDRADSLRRRVADRDHRSHPARNSAAAVASRGVGAPVVRRRRRAGAREVADVPLPVRARHAPGSAPGGRRARHRAARHDQPRRRRLRRHRARSSARWR